MRVALSPLCALRSLRRFGRRGVQRMQRARVQRNAEVRGSQKVSCACACIAPLCTCVALRRVVLSALCAVLPRCDPPSLWLRRWASPRCVRAVADPVDRCGEGG